MKLDIQLFADGKVVIDTELNTRNFQNGLDRMQSATQKAGSTIKNIVVGLGITKAISFAMNQISNSIDGAVSRVDTLNNFPKVMSNLGIEAEEAEKSIKKMSDKLAGLPTTLDQGARAVQRFTSSNGDVAKSTDLFLALNNAILAGGASSEIQASALEQLSQSYAKGKPDMMEWRTAMTAMPAQLKQVAKAMGYVNADELGQALREGSVSMDEFMDTIVRLNEEGVDGFQSFEQQAKNSTGGITTAITVAKTQVVKGVADIIGALNTRLENTQFGSLAGLIQQAGEKAKLAIDQVAQVINGEMSLLDFTLGITNAFNNVLTTINANFPKMFNAGVNAIIEFAKGFLDSGAVQTTMTNITQLMVTISDTVIEKLPDILLLGMDVVIALADGIAQNLPYLDEKIFQLTNKVIDKLGDPAFQEQVAQKGGEIVAKLIIGLIKSIPKVILGIGELKTKIQNEIGKLPGKMINIGINIVKGLWDGFKSEIKNFGKNVGKAIDDVVKDVKKKLKIKSPSRVFKDEVGAMMGKGLEIGFVDSLKDAYGEMQRAIDIEQGKLQANVETGRVFNTLQNSTPVVINLNADVDLDGQKVGRLITPEISRTIKSGGGV